MDKFPLVLSDPDASGKVRTQELQFGQNLANETALLNLIQQLSVSQQLTQQGMQFLQAILQSGQQGQVLTTNQAGLTSVGNASSLSGTGFDWEDVYCRSMNPGGRLSLVTGSAAPSSTVAATTLFYTPYVHDQVPIYNPSTGTWSLYTLTADLSLAASTLTASKVYDIYLNPLNQTTLSLVTGTAWTSDTARASNTTPFLLNGKLVNPQNYAQLLVGIARTNATPKFDDSILIRNVCNTYNKIPRTLSSLGTGASSSAGSFVQVNSVQGEFVTDGTTPDIWTGAICVTCNTASIAAALQCGIGSSISSLATGSIQSTTELDTTATTVLETQASSYLTEALGAGRYQRFLIFACSSTSITIATTGSGLSGLVWS